MSVAENLKATGYADVMVVLKSGSANELAAAGAGVPERMLRHFVSTSQSQDGALLEALRFRGTHFSARAAVGRTSAWSLGVVRAPKSPVRHYPYLGVMLGTVDREGLAGLRKDGAVDKVYVAKQLRLIKPVATAAATAAKGYTWGLKALKVPELHALGHTGKGALVGHLDTGIDASHAALKGVVKAYAEFDALGSQVPGAQPKDSDEHGTHTAGTIAGQPVKGVHFGVAPDAKLVSAMVIEGGNVLARILGGMNWIVGQKARVLSMSLGLIGYDEVFLALTKLLRKRGVLPVFAVGNEGPGTSRYPGNYAEALSVGAYSAQGEVAYFSGSQQFARTKDPHVPDLVAPGVDVISCVPGGKYKTMDGSSMATPHIAGLAAILIGAKPKKTIAQVERAIFKSCTLPAGMLPSRANRGIPDGLKALSLL